MRDSCVSRRLDQESPAAGRVEKSRNGRRVPGKALCNVPRKTQERTEDSQTVIFFVCGRRLGDRVLGMTIEALVRSSRNVCA
jgi:hypothetical protein